MTKNRSKLGDILITLDCVCKMTDALHSRAYVARGSVTCRADWPHPGRCVLRRALEKCGSARSPWKSPSTASRPTSITETQRWSPPQNPFSLKSGAVISRQHAPAGVRPKQGACGLTPEDLETHHGSQPRENDPTLGTMQDGLPIMPGTPSAISQAGAPLMRWILHGSLIGCVVLVLGPGGFE